MDPFWPLEKETGLCFERGVQQEPVGGPLPRLSLQAWTQGRLHSSWIQESAQPLIIQNL